MRSSFAMVCEEDQSGLMTENCAFCKRRVPTRGHHVVPRCKGGTEIVPTCPSCEDFIHQTWSHNELRDEFNTVEKILADARFQKFLRWLHKQTAGNGLFPERPKPETESEPLPVYDRA